MGKKPKPGQPWDRKTRPFRRVVILETVADKVTYRSNAKPYDVLTVGLESFRTMYQKGSWDENQVQEGEGDPAAGAGSGSPRAKRWRR